MAATRSPLRRPVPGPAERVPRFDRVQRLAHWTNAALFGVLVLTAIPLYFASAESVVGRRHLIAQIHLWTGVALPVPLLLAFLGPWGASMRRDLRRINVWTRAEVRWLRSLGSRGPAVTDKFNPGQKLNALFTGGAVMVMLATGVVLGWFDLFPLGWRTGATFVHDTLALLIVVVVGGHIGFALTHPESLRSMVRGWVTRRWAAQHAPGWLAETEVPAPGVAAPDERSEVPARPVSEGHVGGQAGPPGRRV